jgi:hypothetical protein
MPISAFGKLPRFAALLLLAAPLACAQHPSALPSAPTLLRRPQDGSQDAGDPLKNPAAYVAAQFGKSFKLDPRVAPMVGDLDGDGREDLVFVATSAMPLKDQAGYQFKVADPYDSYFGNGNPAITAQFSLHFDGSERCLLVVFHWRQADNKKDAKQDARKISKYVLINTPFDSVSLADLRYKKRQLHAIEAVDRTTLHALVFWDGRRWIWAAQGMAGDDTLDLPPTTDNTKMPPPR